MRVVVVFNRSMYGVHGAACVLLKKMIPSVISQKPDYGHTKYRKKKLFHTSSVFLIIDSAHSRYFSCILITQNINATETEVAAENCGDLNVCAPYRAWIRSIYMERLTGDKPI